jgi:nucleotide-binding universal stress UspA family protein
MAIRDILVHLDGAPASAARLSLAAGLARRLGAHLIGLHVIDVQLPVIAAGDFGGGAAVAELITRLQDDALEAAKPIEASFREMLRREAMSGEWRQVEGTTAGQVSLHGRYVDLTVLGQADPGLGSETPVAAIEAALFTTGRPVLVVPFAGAPANPGRHVVIAWNASREATRAVHDALPLLAAAERVTVVTVNPESGIDGHGEEPGADIATHLARHGLKVEVRRVVGPDLGAGDLLLNEVSDLGADLVVMGGYGHSRFREFVLGGATRTMLHQMTVPLLIAH